MVTTVKRFKMQWKMFAITYPILEKHFNMRGNKLFEYQWLLGEEEKICQFFFYVMPIIF